MFKLHKNFNFFLFFFFFFFFAFFSSSFSFPHARRGKTGEQDIRQQEKRQKINRTCHHHLFTNIFLVWFFFFIYISFFNIIFCNYSIITSYIYPNVHTAFCPASHGPLKKAFFPGLLHPQRLHWSFGWRLGWWIGNSTPAAQATQLFQKYTRSDQRVRKQLWKQLGWRRHLCNQNPQITTHPH